MTTTYTLTRLYTLVLPISTSSGSQIVEFKGVQNMKMHGQFTTNDPALEAALEATPEYQSGVYRITARVGEPSDRKATTVHLIQPTNDAPPAKPQDKSVTKKPAANRTLFT